MRYEVRAEYRSNASGEVASFPAADRPLAQEPDWWGVYENLPDGTQQNVHDCARYPRAQRVADWLNQMPAGVRVTEVIEVPVQVRRSMTVEITYDPEVGNVEHYAIVIKDLIEGIEEVRVIS